MNTREQLIQETIDELVGEGSALYAIDAYEVKERISRHVWDVVGDMLLTRQVNALSPLHQEYIQLVKEGLDRYVENWAASDDPDDPASLRWARLVIMDSVLGELDGEVRRIYYGYATPEERVVRRALDVAESAANNRMDELFKTIGYDYALPQPPSDLDLTPHKIKAWSYSPSVEYQPAILVGQVIITWHTWRGEKEYSLTEASSCLKLPLYRQLQVTGSREEKKRCEEKVIALAREYSRITDYSQCSTWTNKQKRAVQKRMQEAYERIFS